MKHFLALLLFVFLLFPGCKMQEVNSIKESFNSAYKINVIIDNEKTVYNKNDEKFNVILQKLINITNNSHDMPAFGVSLDELTKEGIKTGLWLELEFEEIKDMSPEKFIAFLGKECNAETFVCGEDFRFGKGALGTPETIKELGKNVFVEKILYDGDEKVGSSLIKRCLEKGEIERANTLLGFPFFLQGEVVKDRGVGALIGFPTANIPYPEEKFPLEKGVYESRVFVDGKEYKGITNYGARPTFDNDVVVTETHLISYMGDLYGKTLQVQFIKKLRENKKFENVEKLKEQLEKDVRRVTKDD